jgi:hypothetical protein
LLSERNNIVPQDKKNYLYSLTEGKYTEYLTEIESKIGLEIELYQKQKEAPQTAKYPSRKGNPGPVKPSQERAEERKAQYADKPLRRTFSDRERLLKHVDAENQRRASGESGKGFSLPPQ